MSRVLIWNKIRPGSELDIFHPTDYSELYAHAMTNWNGICQNWGNRLWFQGLYSVLDTGENSYDFLPDTIDFEKINSEYDFIILSAANIFHSEYVAGMRRYAEQFQNIRIPVYVIACGVQAAGYDALDDLISAIGEDSQKFIRAVYNTGGEFALRGYFTKEFFDRLGFCSAVATGCPSLYQLGPNLCIMADRVAQDTLHPVFNGHIKDFTDLMTAFPTSVFADQDEFLAPLFQSDYLRNPDFRFQMNYEKKFGIESARFLAEGRISMIADMNDWWNYLQNQQFNYSYGSRIHGTIMAVLSGVPATIIPCDSRTREMAEFFDIPMAYYGKPARLTKQAVLEAYEQMDYSAFNKKFAQRFRNYEKFLIDHRIVSRANTNNAFFIRKEGNPLKTAHEPGKVAFDEFYASLLKNRRYLSAANNLQRIIRRVFK